ncbi:hypothetical protein WN55_07534 [Dufourea novaeangliae]|uniref:Uncharacterized protein n=1 Tax=Dufourea novaeangliae TaxID=178035 RepID=A0A154P4F7_DUFNO|nr:hypothetical protein WN55_07534 [Dufourea novaeangliae]
MYGAVWATYFQYSYDHNKCPIGIESWCTWQRASANGELRDYKHDYKALPQDVLDAINPIYVDLTRSELLERCFGRVNQNNNESYNQLIWKISPKILPSGFATVELAAHISACRFNEGYWGILQIYAAMVIKCELNIHLYLTTEDSTRVKTADHRAQETTREERMLRRQRQLDILEAYT